MFEKLPGIAEGLECVLRRTLLNMKFYPIRFWSKSKSIDML